MTDTHSQYTFDLSPLSDLGELKVSAVSGSVNYTYGVSVCGKSACGGGACQYKPSDTSFSKNLGTVSNLSLAITGSDELILTYYGGDACHNNAYNRSSVIVFSCDPHAGNGTLAFGYERSDCTYVFSWKTALVCKPAVCGCPSLSILN